MHVDTWRATYRGIVPDAHLNGLSYHESERLWQERFADAEDSGCVFVAEDDGEVFGFASGGTRKIPREALETTKESSRRSTCPPSRQGIGAGRRLARRSMLLWVFADNGPAQRFYESLGGVLVAEDGFELGGA